MLIGFPARSNQTSCVGLLLSPERYTSVPVDDAGWREDAEKVADAALTAIRERG